MKTLEPQDGRTQVLQPTTTTRLAERMLATADVLASTLPYHFTSPKPLRMLLTLLVAADQRASLSTASLTSSSNVRSDLLYRWLSALSSEGFVDIEGDAARLSQAGYAAMQAMLEGVYSAQRELD